jgi:hypothetical protein
MFSTRHVTATGIPSSAACSFTSGESFSRQARLRQIGARTVQDLVLLLQQLDPLTGLAQLG